MVLQRPPEHVHTHLTETQGCSCNYSFCEFSPLMLQTKETHTHTHARAHTHTHTYTHTQKHKHTRITWNANIEFPPLLYANEERSIWYQNWRRKGDYRYNKTKETQKKYFDKNHKYLNKYYCSCCSHCLIILQMHNAGRKQYQNSSITDIRNMKR